MNLDRYGGGCRCLLRIRENLGKPPIADERFIADHQLAYPDWALRPGRVDLPRILELAAELGIANGGGGFRDYNRVLNLHRAGNPVLIQSRRVASARADAEQMALLVDMDETQLSRWVPVGDGSAETIRTSRSEFWDGAQAMGIALYPVQSGAAG
jgi:hypothetical protein